MGEREVLASKSPAEKLRKLATRGAITISVLAGATQVARIGYTTILEQTRLQQIDDFSGEPIANSEINFGLAPHYNRFEEITQGEEALGMEFGIANFFLSDEVGYLEELKQFIGRACAEDKTPMISWGNSGDVFGVYEDSRVRMENFASELAQFNCPIIFRPYYEMNGNWFNFGSGHLSPELFVQGWRRIYNTFQEVGATNVQFMFSPNTTANAAPIEPYFPGEAYVDVVSLDAYNKYSPYPWLVGRHYFYPNLSPQALLGPDITTLRRIAPNTPIILSELGSLEEGHSGQWLKSAIEYAASQGIDTVVFFAWNKADFADWGEGNWRLWDNQEIKESLQILDP